MGIEVERKFLVNGEAWRAGQGVHYCQGYLSRDKHRTVRVRIAGTAAYVTIKGLTTAATRLEFEYQIPMEDAKQLLDLCEPHLVEKIRRAVPYRGFRWEVDEFLGPNSGLIVAEIELESADQPFDLPSWIGLEVTDDPRFFNTNLSIQPFNTWPAGTQV